MIVVGQDIERAIMFFDLILPAGLPRGDQDRLGQRIVGGHQPHFAGFVVARGNGDIFL